MNEEIEILKDQNKKLINALKNVLTPKYGKEWIEAKKVLEECQQENMTPGDKIYNTFKNLGVDFAGKDFRVDTENIKE